MVNTFFANVIGNGLFFYFDDLIIVSRDLDSHFQKLALIFGKLSEADLKVKLTKCNFLRSRIQFLSISWTEMASKVKVVKNFPTH